MLTAFENDVKTYGTQTHCCLLASSFLFENDVKTYGTQTQLLNSASLLSFENDVKTYGTQTPGTSGKLADRLRMM